MKNTSKHNIVRELHKIYYQKIKRTKNIAAYPPDMKTESIRNLLNKTSLISKTTLTEINGRTQDTEYII